MTTTSITINEVLNFITIATPSELARINEELAAHLLVSAEERSKNRHPSRQRPVGVPYVPAELPKSTVPGGVVESFPILSVGDRVRIRGNIRPKYMVGIVGTVVKVNQTRVLVEFGPEAGRFANDKATVPMTNCERLP